MSNGNNVRFGVQIARKFILGAAVSTGMLAPFFATGVMVKRSIKKSMREMPKKTDDFFTRLMKEVQTKMDDAATQTFNETAGDKE